MANSFQILGNLMLPLFICLVLVFGLFKRIKVFDVFILGANEGLNTLIKIMPTLFGIMVAVQLFSKSGLSDFIVGLIKPLCEKIGFPSEMISFTILRPISGSGSTALYNDLLQKFGADSIIGKISSIMAGSTETTFYAITVYYQSVAITKTRHTLICALAADLTAIILSIILVRLIF